MAISCYDISEMGEAFLHPGDGGPHIKVSLVVGGWGMRRGVERGFHSAFMMTMQIQLALRCKPNGLYISSLSG